MSRVWLGTSGGQLNQRSLPAGRWGRLRFSSVILEDMLAGKRWEDIAALGPRFFAVDCHNSFGELEVLALSPDFEPIGDGETAPLYDAWLEKPEDGGPVRFVRFERVS